MPEVLNLQAGTMGMRVYCFLLFFFLLITFRAATQPAPFGQYPLDFVSYQQEEGLSQNSVHALATTPSGLTWIGTEDGLNRFDGYRFRVFRRKPGYANSLSWNHISALAMDAERGQLWIGTIRRGLSVYHTRLDSFTRLPLSITAKASNEWVNHLQFIGNNAWVATDSGVVVLSRSNFSVRQTIRTGSIVKRVLPRQGAVLFYFENGDVWAVSERGEVISRTAAAAFWGEYLQVQDVIKLQDKHCISTTSGFFVYDTRLPEARPVRQQITTRKTDFSRAPFTAYLKDSRGREWLAPDGEGLLVKGPGEAVFQHYTYNPVQPLSLSDNTITAIVEDAENNIWIGSQKGLNRLLKYPGWLHSFTNNGTGESAIFNRLQTVFTPDNNILYIGGKSGLFVLDRQHGTVKKAQTGSAVQTERFYFIRPFAPGRQMVSSFGAKRSWLCAGVCKRFSGAGQPERPADLNRGFHQRRRIFLWRYSCRLLVLEQEDAPAFFRLQPSVAVQYQLQCISGAEGGRQLFCGYQ
jgi:ligand-binding sensor domain-containing protein